MCFAKCLIDSTGTRGQDLQPPVLNTSGTDDDATKGIMVPNNTSAATRKRPHIQDALATERQPRRQRRRGHDISGVKKHEAAQVIIDDADVDNVELVIVDKENKMQKKPAAHKIKQQWCSGYYDIGKAKRRCSKKMIAPEGYAAPHHEPCVFNTGKPGSRARPVGGRCFFCCPQRMTNAFDNPNVLQI